MHRTFGEDMTSSFELNFNFYGRQISAMADYVERGPARALGRAAPLIRFQISRYISCLLVYIVRFPTYPFFFTFFLVISSLENRYDTIRYEMLF